MKKLLFFFAILISANTVFGYDPPVGIPEPNWTVHPIDTANPSKPSPWDEEQSGYYYIDLTSGNDTGRTYGTPSSPRLTIPASLSAGDKVWVTGTDTNAYRYYTGWSGTAANPVWIISDNAVSQAIIRGQWVFRGLDYIYVDGFDFDGNLTNTVGAINMQGGDSYIVVRNCYIRNYTYSSNTSGIGIGASDTYGGDSSYIVLYNNTISALGDYEAEADEDFHGLQFVPDLTNLHSVHHVWMLGSSCQYVSGNCVQVTATTTAANNIYCHHIYIGDNTSSNGRQAGFWSKSATDVIISENTVHDNVPHGTQHGDCFGFQYGPDRLWFINNTCYSCTNGIRHSTASGTGDFYLIGNLIYTIATGSFFVEDDPDWSDGVGISFWNIALTGYVVYNTLYNVQRGISVSQSGDKEVNLANNIVSEISYTGSYHARWETTTSITQDYELYYDTDQSFRVNWAGSVYTTPASMYSATGECQHCDDSDPKFTTPGSDFSLQSDSPARGAGTSDPYGVVATFYSLYGLTLVDRNNNSFNTDIGAIMFEESASPHGTAGGSVGFR